MLEHKVQSMMMCRILINENLYNYGVWTYAYAWECILALPPNAIGAVGRIFFAAVGVSESWHV